MSVFKKLATIAAGAGLGFVSGGPVGAAAGAFGGYEGAREREKQDNKERDAKRANDKALKLLANQAAGTTAGSVYPKPTSGTLANSPAPVATPVSQAGFSGIILLILAGTFVYYIKRSR